ncbi:MAG: hypothetical protein IKJ73_06705 [Lachnospiraceae bacterium]|nr:hypothetical protein [Lachnospiraceae bacterium]
METNRLKVINGDNMKYIAVIPMAIGHFVSYMQTAGVITDMRWWMNVLAYGALFAPVVFFFFITEGFKYTRSRKKYALRLLIFAVITQIPYCLAVNGTLLTIEFFLNLNVIFTLFFGLVTLMAWESGWKLPVRIIAVIFIDVLTCVLGCEWMIFGVLIILGLHIFRDNSKIRFIWFFVCIFCLNLLLNGLFLSMTFWVGFLVQLFAYFMMTICYNGKKGKHPKVAKWFFYIFYPMHFMIIYIAQMIFA